MGTSSDSPQVGGVYELDDLLERSADWKSFMSPLKSQGSNSRYLVVDTQALQMKGPDRTIRLGISGKKKNVTVVFEEAPMPAGNDLAQELLEKTVATATKPDAEVEEMRRMLTRRTVDAVLNGTKWLTSADLNTYRPKSPTSNPSMTIKRWVEAGSMFALEVGGTRMIPLYGLDQLGEPIALLKPILELMKGRTSFLIAAWFESPNTYLDGRRPRDLLATRGLDVVRAAEQHVSDAFHG